MNSSGVSVSQSQSDPAQYTQERLRDPSPRNPAVEPLSDKAAPQAAQVDRLQRQAEKSPSAVYIRSESRDESSYSASIKTAQAAPVANRISPEQASGSILSFIENQLLRDVENGATAEALSSRIEAGLSGFLQGYESAREDLQALGALTPGVQAEIEKTYDAVVTGIEDLKQQFLAGETQPQSASAEVADVSPAIPEETPAANNQSQYYSYQAAQRNSFSFSVTTRDGDTVTIQSSALRSMFQETALLSSANGSSAEFSRYGFGEDYQFELEVGGELDTGELKALRELLSQVNDLAQDFFTGDVTAAFDAALSLGYNDSEISSFALNLSQTSVQRVTAAYSEASPALSSVADSLRPLGNFARGLIEATETAGNFQNPRELISTIAERIDSARQGTDFKSFLERLMDSVQV